MVYTVESDSIDEDEYYFIHFITQIMLSSIAFLRGILHHIRPPEKISPHFNAAPKSVLVVDWAAGNHKRGGTNKSISDVKSIHVIRSYRRWIDESGEDGAEAVFTLLIRIKQAVPDCSVVPNVQS